MSMETHVFFRGKLPSKAALSRAMKELGFPYSIKPATGSLEQQNGFMPMLLRREETGVEFDVFGHDAVEEFADAGVDPSYERVANFRWGGDFQEAVAGMCGAAALAKLVKGIVFDEAENRLLSVEDAIAVARANLKQLPPLPKQRSPSGRTLLKRMLAPLLAKRSDLALIGDLLVIRPVRHLVRGAQFRWSEHETVCSACPFIQPLYQNALPFVRDATVSEHVENPIFAPMLFDRLAAEIFEPLGKIATIEDFIDSRWGKHLFPDDLFPSILLARGIKKAQAHMAPFMSGREKALAEAKARLALTDRKDKMAMYHRTAEAKRAEEAITTAQRRETFLAGGDAAVFGHYRSWEAEVTRALKLKEVWEPSPFPAELPAAERAAKTADLIFTTTPWLDFPDTWRQNPPKTPGEVRFARDYWYREGRVTLLHPIAREQAETWHRNLEHYVLATRMAEGQLLVLRHTASEKGVRLPSLIRYVLWIYDSRGQHLIADFQEDHEEPGVLKMRSINVKGDRDWYSHLSFRDREKSIHNSRKEEKSYERRTMTDAERAAYAFPLPRFGQFDTLWQHITMYLSNEGFGPFT